MGFFNKLFTSKNNAKKQTENRTSVEVPMASMKKQENSQLKEQSSEKIRRDLYNHFPEFKESHDHLVLQQQMLSSIGEAECIYEQDKDIEKLIVAYEKVLLKKKNYLKSDSNTLHLADLYIKAGYLDKAWGYLNMLIPENRAPLHKIRFTQARILKKEKKYYDAIELYMMGYLMKSQWNNTFQASMFEKDISPCVNKTELPDNTVKELSSIISRQVQIRDYDEYHVIQKYRDYLADKNLMK